jgi:hypothetical protein
MLDACGFDKAVEITPMLWQGQDREEADQVAP